MKVITAVIDSKPFSRVLNMARPSMLIDGSSSGNAPQLAYSNKKTVLEGISPAKDDILKKVS